MGSPLYKSGTGGCGCVTPHSLRSPHPFLEIPRHFRALPHPEAVGGPRSGGGMQKDPLPAQASRGLPQQLLPAPCGYPGPAGMRLHGHSSSSCGTAQVNELHPRFLHRLITSLPPPGGFASGPCYSSWSSLGQHRPCWAIWWPSATCPLGVPASTYSNIPRLPSSRCSPGTAHGVGPGAEQLSPFLRCNGAGNTRRIPAGSITLDLH